MEIKFTKMHGIGNDYIYVNCLQQELKNPSEIAREMSKRHFSVGADGLVMICPSFIADAKMRMFNADGSEGKMCGNAIRCVGKYLYDNKLVQKTELQIETLSGIKNLKLDVENGLVKAVEVDMGKANFAPQSIPVLSEEEVVNKEYEVLGNKYKITAVSMGNPHSVIFVSDNKNLDLEKIGPTFENLSIFPERVNTEFVKTLNRRMVDMRVWERGSGETYACGTGACATVAAGCKLKILDFDAFITVRLIGGELQIMCKSDYTVIMKGTATKVYDGVYEYED